MVEHPLASLMFIRVPHETCDVCICMCARNLMSILQSDVYSAI